MLYWISTCSPARLFCFCFVALQPLATATVQEREHSYMRISPASPASPATRASVFLSLPTVLPPSLSTNAPTLSSCCLIQSLCVDHPAEWVVPEHSLPTWRSLWFTEPSTPIQQALAQLSPRLPLSPVIAAKCYRAMAGVQLQALLRKEKLGDLLKVLAVPSVSRTCVVAAV